MSDSTGSEPPRTCRARRARPLAPPAYLGDRPLDERRPFRKKKKHQGSSRQEPVGQISLAYALFYPGVVGGHEGHLQLSVYNFLRDYARAYRNELWVWGCTGARPTAYSGDQCWIGIRSSPDRQRPS
ncbi:hypothetical protein EDB84DRAFT_1678181 [Lactarius hengduanensis]|nr:hypothetical protein EDB84DRAFT_1678181 [Lactarius hengduanensis]